MAPVKHFAPLALLCKPLHVQDLSQLPPTKRPRSCVPETARPLLQHTYTLAGWLQLLLNRCSLSSSSSVSSADLQEKVSKLVEDCWLPEVVIGVVGDTGAGKSSLLNVLLGEAELLPTNGMRACTAAAVELSYAPCTW
jgi:hypothetical protein